MTLLITVCTAVIVTAIWYHSDNEHMNLTPLIFLYWGASLMWFVDAIFEYIQLKEKYFKPTLEEMLNDVFLGFSVIALGLVIWIIILLVKDPKGKIAKLLKKN